MSQQIMPHLQDLSGRKLTQHHWHITLAFLGDVSNEVFDCVRQQASRLTGQAFELSLDTLGHWSRPKVVWLGCSQLPDALSTLANQLNTQIQICGYSPEHKAFKAHMTLMRKVTRKPKPFPFSSITWPINEFVLVESQLDSTGSSYEIIERWPLAQ